MRPVLPLLLLAVALLAACGGSSSPAAPTPSPGYVIPAVDLADMLSEKVLGNPAATVSIIEYSSLTCPHCATFHTSTLPQIKAAYIDTGKVKLVYRDFPVPGASTQTVAMAAAGLARCAGTARYFDALDALYRTQGTWTVASNPYSGMKQAIASLGMASDKMDACMASTDVQNEINRVMAEAQATYNVSGTPTFIVGSQKIIGDQGFAAFDAILRPLVNGATGQ
jgi:protein-disulfide isomerase